MSLLRLFRRSRNNTSHQAQAHLTWAKSSVGRRMSQTGIFLKRQIWIWPIVAIVLLSLIGFTVQRAIESTIKHNLGSGLQALLGIEVAMLEAWFDVQKSNAETYAKDRGVREEVYGILAAESAAEDTDQAQAMRQDLQKDLAPLMNSHDYEGYHVIDKSGRIIASSYPTLIGQADIPEYDEFVSRALDGQTNVSPPFPSVVMMDSPSGRPRAGQPSMFVCAPIRNNDFQIVAVLALQIGPDREFTRILQLSQFGESGEAYAFNKEGLLVSNSRFDEELILAGLLPDQEHARSILNLLVRAPAGDVTRDTGRRNAEPSCL